MRAQMACAVMQESHDAVAAAAIGRARMRVSTVKAEHIAGLDSHALPSPDSNSPPSKLPNKQIKERPTLFLTRCTCATESALICREPQSMPSEKDNSFEQDPLTSLRCCSILA